MRNFVQQPRLRPLVGVVVFGLILRSLLILHSGRLLDILLFERWAAKVATFGIGHMYDPTVGNVVPDYPPFLLYVLWPVGKIVYAAHHSFAHSELFVILLKVPAILADCLIALCLFRAGKSTSKADEKRTSREIELGTTAAALFFLLPASWLDSAVWGQTDAVYSGFLLVAFLSTGVRRPLLAGSAAAFAFATKFQTVGFLPILAVGAAAIDYRLLWKSTAAFLVTLGMIFVPLIATGQGTSVVHAYRGAVGAYEVASVGAFNVWDLFLGSGAWRTSDLQTVAGITLRSWGLIGYTIGLTGLLVATWAGVSRREGKERSVFLLQVGAGAALLFFLVPTQIHERYLYPFIVFGALWALAGNRELLAYVIISFAVALNISHGISISITNALFAKLPAAPRIASALIVATTLLSISSLVGGRPKVGAKV